MTRKRTRESLVQYLCEECEDCGGRGYMKSKETVAYEILREIKREAAVLPVNNLYIYANQQVIDFLKFREKKMLGQLERDYGKSLHLFGDSDTHLEEFNVSHKKVRARKGA